MALFNRHYVEEFDNVQEALEYLNETLITLNKSNRDIKVEKVLIKKDIETSDKFTMVLNIQYDEGK